MSTINGKNGYALTIEPFNMLICYLDDSGTDAGNRLITCAGYIARAEQWVNFEKQADPVFNEYGVTVLHTMDMENSDGIYKNWSILKKQSFVSKICGVLSAHALMGMTMSVVKPTYKSRAEESDRKRTITPYAFCAQVILQWIMTDIKLGRIAHDEGLSFLFEEGDKNNREIANNLEALRTSHEDFNRAYRSISFVPKHDSRAIQMADLLAYHSRKHGVRMEGGHVTLPAGQRDISKPDPDMMIKIITERLPHKGFVATDFGPEATGARLFSEIRKHPRRRS
ncbi:DUF3800 domain-containing protein [Ferrovibrio xuzhouensis]|uniref:DUF3800 domain-containing protein n=1 Tax=Ferrovibrio xuzhouensis TaxID=1576914 RepID=A0ABV7VN67_9PROT